MKKFKGLALAIILAILTTGGIQSFATATPVYAAISIEQGVYTTSDGLYKYNINNVNGEVTITQYLGHDSSVTIPQYINNNLVTYIAKNAFNSNTSIKAVVIPSLKGIKDGAFYGCTSLNEVKIHQNTKTFGLDVFKNCPVKKITIDCTSPTISTEQVSSKTLKDWTTAVTRMTGLNINNVTQKYYSNNQFIKNLLTDYTYTISNNQLTVIRYNGTLTELPIPSTMEGATVVAIGPDAFGGNLTSVSLPSTVTTIGKNAIFDCPTITNITLSSETACLDGYALAGDNVDLLTIYYNSADTSTLTQEIVEETIENNYNMDPADIFQIIVKGNDGDSILYIGTVFQ